MFNPNDFSKFSELVRSGDKEPSRSNLFELTVQPPLCMYTKGGRFDVIDSLAEAVTGGALTQNEYIQTQREYYEYINYFADSVTVPGRRLTVGTVRDVGAMRRFATDTSFSEMQVSFIVTKDYWHRKFFERWMNYAASDSENRVSFYEEYTSKVQILKWELASNFVATNKVKGTTYESRLNAVTGAWTLYGAFPFDMSAIQLSNGPTDLIKLDVSFYYERYRFDTLDGKKMFRGEERDRKINADSAEVLQSLRIDPVLTDIAGVGI